VVLHYNTAQFLLMRYKTPRYEVQCFVANRFAMNFTVDHQQALCFDEERDVMGFVS